MIVLLFIVNQNNENLFVIIIKQQILSFQKNEVIFA